jgi:hypothetical protein
MDVPLEAGVDAGRGVGDCPVPGPMSQGGTSSDGTPVWVSPSADMEEEGINPLNMLVMGGSTPATPW